MLRVLTNEITYSSGYVRMSIGIEDLWADFKKEITTLA
jgi:hypothetical protein